jgi:hypothetical protein
VGDDLVGDDHRDRDRDQGLAELLALVPAEETLLRDQAHDGDAGRRDEERKDPLPRVHVGGRDREALTSHRLLNLVGDVAAEEVEGAVRHVHDAHQPENQGEPARDDEERSGEGDRVEEDSQKRAGVVHSRAEGGRAPVAAARRRRLLGDEEDIRHREDDAPAHEEQWYVLSVQPRGSKPLAHPERPYNVARPRTT